MVLLILGSHSQSEAQNCIDAAPLTAAVQATGCGFAIQ
jgi:hypothetical protein